MSPSCMSRNKLIAAALLAASIVSIAAPASLRAEGNSVPMGMLMTVVPDGASDAARNPALLGFQEKRRSFSAALRAAPYATQSVDVLQEGGFKYGMDMEYTGGFSLSGAMRAGSAVYALSLASVPDEDQFTIRENTLTMNGYQYFDDVPIPGNYDFRTRVKEKVFEFQPSLVFAFAFPLSGGGLFGMQIIAGFSHAESDESNEFALFSGGVPYISGSSEFSSRRNGFSLEAGFGYVQRLGNGHTGLVVRTGSLSFDRESGNLSNNYGPGDSDSTGNSFRYSTGIMIMAGLYQRPLPFLGFALEAGYRFPVSYKYRELGTEDSMVVENVTMVDSKDKFQFKAGLEFLASSALTISGGFVLSFDGTRVSKDSDDDGDHTENQDFTLAALVLGGAYRVNGNTLVTATLGYIRASVEMERMLSSEYARIDMIVGATYSY